MRLIYSNLRLASVIFLLGLSLVNNSCKSGAKQDKETGLESFLTEEDI
jgi:hypothetical protein